MPSWDRIDEPLDPHDVRRRPIRVGVIGAGNIATLGHIPGLRRSGAARVVAICDREPERARAVAARFGIGAAYDDAVVMLDAVDLDAVTVATPPIAHAPAVLAALERGRHVLCEKPLATTVADAQRMVETAERAGLVLAMNLHFRVLRETLALKAAVDEGRLGRIRYVHIRYLRGDFFPAPASWVRDPGHSAGGALADMGSHIIDLAFWLAGARVATSVDAHLHETDLDGVGGAARPAAWSEDFASVRMRLDTGATATVECSWGYFGSDESRIQIIGERGGADVFPLRGRRSGTLRFFDQHDAVGEPGRQMESPAGQDVRRLSLAIATGAPSSSQPRPVRNRRTRLWYRSMASFVAAVRGDGPAVATGRDGLAVQRVLEAAYRSHAAGAAVAIPDMPQVPAPPR